VHISPANVKQRVAGYQIFGGQLCLMSRH